MKEEKIKMKTTSKEKVKTQYLLRLNPGKP